MIVGFNTLLRNCMITVYVLLTIAFLFVEKCFVWFSTVCLLQAKSICSSTVSIKLRATSKYNLCINIFISYIHTYVHMDIVYLCKQYSIPHKGYKILTSIMESYIYRNCYKGYKYNNRGVCLYCILQASWMH